VSVAVAERSPFAGVMRGENRAIAWSVIVHVLVVAAFVFVPREWLTSRTEKPKSMTISLSGSPGPRTGGIAALGGQPKTVAPEPKRPEPKPIAAAKPEPAPATVVKPQKPVATPPPNAPAAAVNRPPPPSREVVQGTSKADTGVKGEGTGLAQGGGGAAAVELADFCCMPYIDTIVALITQKWQDKQSESGTVQVKFVIKRDGSRVGMPEYDIKTGNGLLDRAALRAVIETTFPPLPPAYTGETLTLHLKFVYKGPQG
jgi:outer membrane biosynthesis protein TonB